MSNGKPPSRVEVLKGDLPVSCPPEGAKWNMHPRIYLPMAKGGKEASCPYCGTLYVIVDGENSVDDQGKQGN